MNPKPLANATAPRRVYCKRRVASVPWAKAVPGGRARRSSAGSCRSSRAHLADVVGIEPKPVRRSGGGAGGSPAPGRLLRAVSGRRTIIADRRSPCRKARPVRAVHARNRIMPSQTRCFAGGGSGAAAISMRSPSSQSIELIIGRQPAKSVWRGTDGVLRYLRGSRDLSHLSPVSMVCRPHRNRCRGKCRSGGSF